LTEPQVARLLEVWVQARDLGFLGPGPVEMHLTVSRSLLAAVAQTPAVAVDLGTGAGVPGLALAMAWTDSRWLLLDSNGRRTEFVAEAARTLDLADRVEVVRERAELAGRELRWRGRADLVVARGFGPPAVTAECAAPFLRVGGSLLVTDPPAARTDRWRAAGLAPLGLAPEDRSVEGTVGSWVRCVQRTPCPDRYPRRVGQPAKRPLFS
jgi:16S rRNA (guanine527-N7)-methyltransferase